MQSKGLSCGGCKARWFPEAAGAAQALERCPGCGAAVKVWVYPAYGRAAEVVRAEPVVMGAEAPCFFHPTQRAVVACETCGCFLCNLCDLEFGGRHLCPPCLETAEREAKAEALERRRLRHDHVVWALVLVPLIGCGVLMPLTAPLAMGYAAWKWRAAGSLVSRSRLRIALAMPVALAELAAGIWLWAEVFLK